MTKIICVPKDADALALMDTAACPDEDLITLSMTADSADFKTLRDSYLLIDLNNALGTWIDDFEEDDICGPERLQKAREICAQYQGRFPDKAIFAQIVTLMDDAITRETGIFFYF